jgi:hypothetical protein
MSHCAPMSLAATMGLTGWAQRAGAGEHLTGQTVMLGAS